MDRQGIDHVAIGIAEHNGLAGAELERHVDVAFKFRPPRWGLRPIFEGAIFSGQSQKRANAQIR